MASGDAPECGWRLGLCAGCELCSFRHDVIDATDLSMSARKIVHHVPVSAQQLIDAGIPLPPGMEPPQPVVIPRWSRVRYRIREAMGNARRRVGYWIAGDSPDDWGD